jgi:protein-S-isoprenylcysteine O-methyltransferase Ste14
MATLALVLWALYGLLAFVLRVAIQLRRTGDTGLRGVKGKPGSVEWLVGVAFPGAIALGVAAPILALADNVEPIASLDKTAFNVAGIALYAIGLGGLIVAQGTMGESWRVGVDATERTSLVTTGMFSIVRNPIFTAMVALTVGLALLVPSVISVLAVALLLLSVELQTRAVEEPYLLDKHGQAYASYAGRVGRFLPGVGCLRAGA